MPKDIPFRKADVTFPAAHEGHRSQLVSNINKANRLQQMPSRCKTGQKGGDRKY